MKHIRLGIAFSTYNRHELMNKTMASTMENTRSECVVSIACDGCDVSSAMTMGRAGRGNFHALDVIRMKGHIGIAKTKNAAIHAVLKYDFSHLVIMEDDVRPIRLDWEKVLIETAACNDQKHLTYSPGKEAHYGVTRRLEGPTNRQIAWKRNVSGFLLYFERKFLEGIGAFDDRFGLYGWEHNALSDKALSWQGISPQTYPHCLELERGVYIEADDMKIKCGPSEAKKRNMLAKQNEGLYRVLQLECAERLKKFPKPILKTRN